MRIEGYMVIPWGGQCRFAFVPYSVTELEKSMRGYDHFWDATMRGRPTLHELMDEEDKRSREMRCQYESYIVKALAKVHRTLMNSSNSVIKHKIGELHGKDLIVEFVRVTNG